MVTVTIDCDKCEKMTKTFKTLGDMSEMVQDYPDPSIEVGFVLCPDCYTEYRQKRRELKEKYNKVINDELIVFVKGG